MHQSVRKISAHLSSSMTDASHSQTRHLCAITIHLDNFFFCLHTVECSCCHKQISMKSLSKMGKTRWDNGLMPLRWIFERCTWFTLLQGCLCPSVSARPTCARGSWSVRIYSTNNECDKWANHKWHIEMYNANTMRSTRLVPTHHCDTQINRLVLRIRSERHAR